MYIELETDAMTEADAFALAVLIHQEHPSVLGRLAFMTSAATAALNSRGAPPESPALDPEEAFGGDLSPAAVAPSAEDAFGGPQPQGAGAPPVTDADGNGAPTSVPAAPAGDGAGQSAASAPPSSGPAAVVDLDTNGLPWDGRIHSSNHKKNGDGKWAKRKGVSADTVTTVEAELRARLAAGPLASTPPAAPPPPASVAPTSSMIPPTPGALAAPAAATAPPPPAAPAVSAPPVPPVSAPTTSNGAAVAPAPVTPPPVLTPEAIAHAQNAALAAAAPPPPAAATTGGPVAVAFTDVMRQVVDATQAGTLTPDELTNVCAAVGLDSPRQLLTAPNLCGPFLETLNMYLASKAPA